MGFVVKRSSRMQEQFFSFPGGTGICFRAGLKKSGRGRNFAGEGWAPPGSDTPKVHWGGLSVRHSYIVDSWVGEHIEEVDQRINLI